ncbi:ROK family protein [Romboutsia sp. 1001713B170207_170306_H8]|uniref:ROK family protein n=1 Tax=Romboutsia sp. 1001713B170207_170306_H8 TaxID=2787112 RepID=UPI000822C396|nr:ROK family protein [Romboutsia sp. 1001713B170207_170306_H8]SCI02873.1 Beta-glucoside kinase [uncultured Clostridium sp.]
MKKYICIDVGGTSIKYGLLNEDLNFVTTDEMNTEAQKGGQNILNKIIEIVNKYNSFYDDIDGVCISTAGMVDCEKGEIIYASPIIPNYTGMKIKETIENKFNIKCEVENDVNCAALAEHFAGGAKGSKISVCLTIGTGIGGAIIINNEVYHGAFGSGGEVGYMNMMGSTFQELGASSVLVKKVAELKNVSHETINGKYIFEKAKEGDLDCINAIDEMIEVLGQGIANICYIINPEVVVLGGGIMGQKEYLYDKIRDSIDRNLIPFIAKKTKLEFAVNQNKAGMLGAYFNFINMQKRKVKDVVPY